MDMDLDLAAPAIAAPDSRQMHAAGSPMVDALLAVYAPVTVRVPSRAPVPAPVLVAPAATVEASRRLDADVPASEVPPARLPRVRVETPLLDNQVYAAAQLIGRGLATRVVLVNAAVDSALPEEWEILGTPIRLSRLADGRAVVTAGGPRA